MARTRNEHGAILALGVWVLMLAGTMADSGSDISGLNCNTTGLAEFKFEEDYLYLALDTDPRMNGTRVFTMNRTGDDVTIQMFWKPSQQSTCQALTGIQCTVIRNGTGECQVDSEYIHIYVIGQTENYVAMQSTENGTSTFSIFVRGCPNDTVTLGDIPESLKRQIASRCDDAYTMDSTKYHSQLDVTACFDLDDCEEQ